MKNLKKYRKLIIVTLVNLILLVAGFIWDQLIPAAIILFILDIILFLVFKPKKKKFSGKELFKTFCIICFTIGTFVLIAGGSFIIYIISITDPFDPKTLYNEVPSVIVDKNGNEMMKIGEQLRTLVDYEDMSQSLIDAVVATEDSRYYQHSGVDLPRFLVASLNQALGRDAGGASTITMQVSKLTQTTDVSTGIEGIIRKFQDIYLSVFELERRYTKEEILEFYLNYVGMGGIVNGIGQASYTYFNKSASELNIAESAMLAGMFQSPEYYNPLYYPENCEERRKEVLYLMLRHEYITQEEYEVALELTVEELLVDKPSTQTTSEYQDYLDTVISEVIARTGTNPASTSMIITANIDTTMQDHVNSIMSGEGYNWPDEYIQSGSVVMNVHNGEILAVGAGRDRVAGDFNFATQSNRHIGSTAKPIYEFGPALEFLNYNTYSPLVDEPHSYSGSTVNVNNFDNSYKDMMTFETALKESRNTTALKLFQTVSAEAGSQQIIDFVTSLGLNPNLGDNGVLYEGHSLGSYDGESPLSLVAAYAAFSNGGYYVEPHSFTTIEYLSTGETYTVKPEKTRVMSEETAYMMTSMLQKTADYMFYSKINGYNSAAKSGTSTIDPDMKQALGLPSNINDRWIAGYNQDYAITMWLGYEELEKETYKTSSLSTTQRNNLYKAIASGIYNSQSSWDKPDGVVEVEVERDLPTAMLPSEFTPDSMKTTALFKKGFEPTETSDRYAKLPDVTNLKYDEDKDTLTWDAIATPNFYNSDYLTQLYDPIYNSTSYLSNKVNAILNYNNSNLGQITYEVYTKDSSGNLTLVGSTINTSYKHYINGTTTFVVKTTYPLYTYNSSDGATASIQKETDVISIELTTKDTITISLNDKYSDAFKPVRVFENGTDEVTSESKITYKITKSDKTTVATFDDIDTSVEETYTITYTVTYKSFSDTISKKLIVE